METHELLRFTEEELKQRPLVEQIKYWQIKYEAAVIMLNRYIQEDNAKT